MELLHTLLTYHLEEKGQDKGGPRRYVRQDREGGISDEPSCDRLQRVLPDR